MLPSPMFSLQIYQKQFVRHTSLFAQNSQTLFAYTCLPGSSTNTAKQQPKIAKEIDRKWPPTGIPPTVCLFVSASYVSTACYPMNNHDVINIGLGVIKRCGMYSKEYKNWIACKSKTPVIVETIDSFKKYWARAITLINQTS